MQKPLTQSVDAHEKAGKVLAKQIAKDLEKTGSLLLLAPPPPPEGLGLDNPQTWMARQTQGFLAGLPNSITVHTVPVSVAQTRDAQMTGASAELQWKNIRKALEKHPKVSAIVSLVGCPKIPKTAELPPLYVLSRSGDQVHDNMTAGYISFAIVPCNSAQDFDSLRGDWFSVFYETVTPDTVAAWHQAGKGSPPSK